MLIWTATFSMIDVTSIQEYLAKLITFNEEQKLAADVDMDGNITVHDATRLQKIIAHISCRFV